MIEFYSIADICKYINNAELSTVLRGFSVYSADTGMILAVLNRGKM